MAEESVIIVWGIDQSPAVNIMLDKLKEKKVVKDYRFTQVDPENVEYNITCFERSGFFKIGYESAYLIKYLNYGKNKFTSH